MRHEDSELTSPREPGPDFASLGVGAELIPMDITQHGGVLNPSSWPFLDPRVGLQAIQEQASRQSGTTNYIGHNVDFQQNANITQQQLQILSSNDIGSIPGTVMQMPPVGLGIENVSAHVGESHARSQGSQTQPETTETESDEDFDEANYLNEDTASEQDASEDEGHDEARHVEAELSISEAPHRGADSPVPSSTQDDCDMTPSGSEDGNPTGNAVALEYCNSPSPASSDTTPSSSTDDQRSSDSAVVTANPAHETESKSSLEGLDIVKDRSKVSDLIKALEDKGALAEFLEGLGYQKLSGVDIGIDGAPSVLSAGDNSQVVCSEPNCGKKFPRPCELKYVYVLFPVALVSQKITDFDHRKHQKRHEKPYGCTFSNCYKKFGSKNDWKRHENSQHHQLELWKCDEPSKADPKELCGRACHRREQFKIHLFKDHGICDPPGVDVKLDSCRVGRNCETQFWCGFCKKIVEIREDGLKAWTERFNHIDDHFSGRNAAKMSISEWKSCDSDSLDIDLNLPGSNEESRSGSPGPSSDPSSEAEAEAGRKRGADAVARGSRARKRLRVTETMWFCVSFLLALCRLIQY